MLCQYNFPIIPIIPFIPPFPIIPIILNIPIIPENWNPLGVGPLHPKQFCVLPFITLTVTAPLKRMVAMTAVFLFQAIQRSKLKFVAFGSSDRQVLY